MYKQYNSSQLNNYNKSRCNVENPSTIILLLYETILASLRRSLLDIDKKNIESAHKHITKAKMIVSELNYSLNPNVGSEVSANLKNLYNYIYERLLEANIHKNKRPIEESITLLRNVYEGWKVGLRGSGNTFRKMPPDKIKNLSLQV